MKQDELKKRVKQYAHRCVKLVCSLPDTTLGKHLRGQLIRCSTSAAANYNAACVAHTKATFIAKLSIVIEECDESIFWLEFIVDECFYTFEKVEPLLKEGRELCAIFISARKTAKENSIAKIKTIVNRQSSIVN